MSYRKARTQSAFYVAILCLFVCALTSALVLVTSDFRLASFSVETWIHSFSKTAEKVEVVE